MYSTGKRRSNSHFTVFFRANQLPESRFGFSIKKALGGALVRNRIRRRVREIVRCHRQEIPAGWDIVIHPKKSVQQAEFAAEEKGYTATKHQREVGAGYFDAVTQTVAGGTSSITALTGSTEEQQFERA